MNAPKNPWRLPIPDDACSVARDMLAQGVNPDGVIEFMRGDVVCLRGTVRAFASRMVKEGRSGARHVPYVPFDASRLHRGRPPAR